MIFKPPMNVAKRDRNKKSVFLAGSIEMGKAEDWQARVGNLFLEQNYNVFNPRREDWDASWIQSFDNPNFYQQVTWELTALKEADVILMYFAPETLSPISLLELGRYATSGKMHVVCPSGYWRKGNVEVLAHQDGFPLYDDFDSLFKVFKF